MREWRESANCGTISWGEVAAIDVWLYIVILYPWPMAMSTVHHWFPRDYSGWIMIWLQSTENSCLLQCWRLEDNDNRHHWRWGSIFAPGDNIGTARFPSGLTTDFGSNFSRSEYAHVWLASARWSNMVNGSPPAASCKDHCLAPFLHLQNREAGSHTGCCTTGGLPLKEGPIYLGLILDITLLISSY